MPFGMLVKPIRADEGKYSVLVGQDSGALKREYTSQFRESLMIEALSQVQSMDPKTFMQRVCSQL